MQLVYSVNCSQFHCILSGAHDPERAASPFSCNGVFTSKVILRCAFPAKTITVSGYLRIEIWVNKKMAAQRYSFCFGIPFSTCLFLSFQSIHSLNWASHNIMRFILQFPHLPNVQETFGTFHRVRVRSRIDLNPRFVSFSHAFVMIKYTFNRLQKKWKDLIVTKKYLR